MGHINNYTVIESPYAGNTVRNLKYLAACFCDCLAIGEAPIASHKLYADVCCGQGKNRDVGIEAGIAWGSTAHYIVVYVDFGITEGMKKAIAEYRKMDICIKYRSIAGYNEEVTNIGDCPSCSLPLDSMSDGEPRILFSCDCCGAVLGKPVKIGKPISGLPSETPVKYRKLLDA